MDGGERVGEFPVSASFCTFYFVSEEFAVVHRDQRVAEQRAEEIEEGDDAVGVFERHGRPS